MTAVLAVTVEFERLGPCCVCGIEFAAPTAYVRARRADHKGFMCPNGHDLAFTGETEAEKLRKRLEWKEAELARERERSATIERSRDVYKGKLRAQTERVKNGVCPCCKRSFTNLRRHIATKHPDFTHEASDAK